MNPAADAVSHKPIIRRGTRDYTYHVESSTRPGLVHNVDVLHLTCSCEAGAYGRRCHHLADAIVYDAWRKAQRAKATASTLPSVSSPATLAPLNATAGYQRLNEAFG